MPSDLDQGATNVETGAILYFVSLFGILTLISPQDGLLALPIRYFLKNNLRADAVDIAVFDACTNLPVYLAVIFGLWRDWFVRHSRTEILWMRIAIAGICGVYLCLGYAAVQQLDYPQMLLGVLTAMVFLTLLNTFVQAQMTLASRLHGLTQLSAIWNIAGQLPVVSAFLIGGWLVQVISLRQLFVWCGLATVVLLWRQVRIGRARINGSTPAAVARATALPLLLRRHRRFWLVLAVIMLFTFSPGWQTPLFYFLTNQIGLTSEQYGLFMAVVAASTIAGNVIFGVYARYRTLRTTLWFGTVLLIVQSPLPLFIHDAFDAQGIAAISGLLYGFAIGGYWALVMRASPVGLEATAFALAVSVSIIGTRFGDLLGSWIFQRGGFAVAMVVTTATTALILPVLAALPKEMVENSRRASDIG